MEKAPVGSVVISVDAELGWGFHDLTSPPVDRIEAAREGWERLLALFDEYDVPATWAVVGHLFLDDCDGVHAGHPTPPGWFAREHGEWADRPEWRFGGDLVEDLLDADAGHDVGCHTFSHVVASDPRVTGDVFRAELAASREATHAYGVELDSFVFPRNAVGHRDVLAAAGFSVYRGSPPPRSPAFPPLVEKVADTLAPDRVPLVHPTVDEYGLVDIPPSLYLFGIQGVPRRLARSIWTDPVVRQAKRGIDRAVREDGVFHAWLHPNNLLDERDVARVRAVLEHAADRCDRTSLDVETMREVAARVPAH